jgi:hypothetical protein
MLFQEGVHRLKPITKDCFSEIAQSVLVIRTVKNQVGNFSRQQSYLDL